MCSNSAPSDGTENGSQVGPSHGPTSCEPSQARATALLPSGRCNVLLLSFLSFVLIGFGVWVFSAGSRYRQEYTQAIEGWRIGSTRVVELTIVKEDKRNLGCAADPVIAGLHCGHRRDLQEVVPVSADNPQILQPYNTVGNELLLGAGLWNCPDLAEPLPEGRFTVVCSFQIKGVMKSAAIRFDASASFGPVGRTITLGTFSDCMISR
jgi:hypothetical protein